MSRLIKQRELMKLREEKNKSDGVRGIKKDVDAILESHHLKGRKITLFENIMMMMMRLSKLIFVVDF